MNAIDHAMMTRALRLAARGLYTTQPNPRVGCVIAKGGQVIAEGWHQRAGGPHAEVFALAEAGERARGATAYVTLEPCAHHGRTPPCCDALIRAGLARVVVAAEDPFPEVDGRGIERLRAAGISVETGFMREAARELNAGFHSRIERGRPFVRLKLAMSLDGRTALANGSSQWITGEPARADVHRWRARSSAILTGIGTVLADDPRLDVRLDDGSPVFTPLRVVLDSRLRIPADARMFRCPGPVLIGTDASRMGTRPDLDGRCEIVALPAQAGSLDLDALLRALAARGVNELHVEAGPVLSGALLERRRVDELLLYVAPCLLGGDARPLLTTSPLSAMDQRWNLRLLDQRRVGDDLRLRYAPA